MASPIRVIGLDQIVLNTANVNDMLAFYTNVLGLQGVRVDQLAAAGVVDVARGPVEGLFGASGFARSLYSNDPDGKLIELRSY